jgi:hypothetical protein
VLLSLAENGVSQQTVGPRLTVPGDVKGGRYVSGSAIVTVFRAPAGPAAADAYLDRTAYRTRLFRTG